MRPSVVRAASIVASLAGGLVAFGAGCTSILGDFSSSAPESTDSGGADVVATEASSPGPDASNPADAGGTGPSDAGADAPTWSPSQLDTSGKLALWLEAKPSTLEAYDAGDAGLVWVDQSKNANNGINSGYYPPVYEPAAVNGHDALHFNQKGSAVTIADAPTLQFGTDQFFIAVVARTTTGSSYFFSKATTGYSGAGPVYAQGFEFFTDSNVEDDAGNPLNDDAGIALNAPAAHVDNSAGDQIEWLGRGFEDNAYHVVIIFRQNPRLLSLTVDSAPAQVQPIVMTDISEVGTDVTLGTVPYGSFRPAMDLSIAEMLVIHSSVGVVDNADITAVRAYLQRKYGL